MEKAEAKPTTESLMQKARWHLVVVMCMGFGRQRVMGLNPASAIWKKYLNFSSLLGLPQDQEPTCLVDGSEAE